MVWVIHKLCCSLRDIKALVELVIYIFILHEAFEDELKGVHLFLIQAGRKIKYKNVHQCSHILKIMLLKLTTICINK